MRSTKILSIAAFIVAFGFSAVVASLFIPIPQVLPVDTTVISYKPTSCFRHRHNSDVADKITVFIRQDENNGSNIDETAAAFNLNDSDSVADYAEAVGNYVEESAEMDAGDLPREFQTAWREHKKAWRNYSVFLNKLNRPSTRGDFSSEDFQNFEKSYNREISQTWDEVLRTGASYGADVR